MTLKEALALATRRLARAGCDTPGLDAEVLLGHVLAKERAWLYTYPDTGLSPDQLARFDELVARRARREPVAYLTGVKAFFGLDFLVNRHVLIPRPETELLVETALHIAGASPVSIADVGTGSGCIAVSLAKNLPQAHLYAIDASALALDVARENAARHGVLASITFLQGNLLEPLPRPVDMIASNPPYISRGELEAALPEVSRYEPYLALNGGEDGLEAIRQLLAQARGRLKSGAAMLVEIGSSQGPAAGQLARQFFPSATIEIKQDLAGLDRLLVLTV